jgi:deoxycytidine triphosphate deaminase
MASETVGSVLSDRTIRARLAELVEGGTDRFAREAGYEFLPGKLYPTGEAHNGMPIDWTGPGLPPEANYAVRRGELLLVRTRERVRMPDDMCGFWSQLDRNSRQGLLLVNTTVVPPGYQGFLTCTFVNFGNASRVLKPESPVARLVFVKLDQPVQETGGVYDRDAYDSRMSDAAREAPSTFLAISERAAELEIIVAGSRKAFDEHGDRIVTSVASGLESSLKGAKEELEIFARVQKEKLETDATGALKKAFPWAILAVALLAFAKGISDTYLSSNVDRLAKERADQIEAKIIDQLGTDARGKPVIVYTGTSEGKALADRIASLEEQVRTLSAKPNVK